MQDWLFEVEKSIQDYNKSLEERANRVDVFVTSDWDKINADTIKISICGNFSISEIKSSLLKKVANSKVLTYMHILGPAIDFEFINSLHLDNLEDLLISVEGYTFNSILRFPKLRKLTVFQRKEVLPLLLSQEEYRFSFEGMPEIEYLNMHHWDVIAPSSFAKLKKLKELSLLDCKIDNLLWLKDAHYSLESITINNNVSDCTGIEVHENLRRINLWNNNISEISIFKQLPNLLYLNLLDNNIQEDNVNLDNVSELYVTSHDKLIRSVNVEINRMVRSAVSLDRSRERMFAKNKNINSPYYRRHAEDYLSKSLGDRMQVIIQDLFEKKVKQDSYTLIAKENTDEFRDLFIERCIELYPFIVVSRERGGENGQRI